MAMTFKNGYDNWEFRAKENGELECRNESKKLDWAVRAPAQIGYFDDHFAILWDALNGLSATLPREGFSIPQADPLVIPQDKTYDGHL